MRRRTIYDGDREVVGERLAASGRDSALRCKESQFLLFDNVDIHFVHRVHEDESAPTLVFLHGFSGSLFNFSICPMWQEVPLRSLPRLILFVLTAFLQLAGSHSLLAFDRPGWGLSGRPASSRQGVWSTTSGDNP
jgi:pimeloyl-ACP methyl ester carboxylesterase